MGSSRLLQADARKFLTGKMSGDNLIRPVVWFKRDLRLADHAPLAFLDNCRNSVGGVLYLYIVESSLWQQPDAARQHYLFLLECLRDLGQALRMRGAQLTVAVGEATEVLSALNATHRFTHLLSHEETGNDATYRRDLRVASCCREAGVQWKEWPQHGVVRALANRAQWDAHWHAHMRAECAFHSQELPKSLAIESDPIPEPAQLGLNGADTPLRQRGGRQLATGLLKNFLSTRCSNYRFGLSSPLLAPNACSRLSPYLALGCLSIREVVQATQQQISALDHFQRSSARQGLIAFLSRLHWHCHFIQKLEIEPAIEFQNMHRGYDGLREHDWNEAHFRALVSGRTGWPMVDASVEMLRQTGWINFRMRAMIISVASYPLWLHWRPVGLWLARQFLDYEPGIHWSQVQMQAGTTGINTTRIYNPIKQARDHDPSGRFVRRWLPTLRRVPDAWLFEPWRMSEELQARIGVRVGSDPLADWPSPQVDLAEATRQAKNRVYALRGQPEVRAAKAEIIAKHA